MKGLHRKLNFYSFLTRATLIAIYLFFGSVPLTAYYQIHSEYKKEDLKVDRKDFITKNYSLIEKMSRAGDKEHFFDTIRLLKKPSYAIIKFFKGKKIKFTKKYIVANNELWLMIYWKKYYNYKIVLIDDGFDRFVYEGKDALFDRIGYINEKNFYRVKTKKLSKKKGYRFTLPVNNKEVKFIITQQEYIVFLREAIQQLAKEYNHFVPYNNTLMKIIAPDFVEKNPDDWKLIISSNQLQYLH